MKTSIKITLLVLLPLFIIACEKKDLFSDREKIESELKSITESEGLTKCNITEFYDNSRHSTITNSPFSFSNGFIIVYNIDSNPILQYRYNLTFLYSYHFAADILFLDFIRQ